MKHKLYTRLLSLALAVGLVIGMLPSAAAVDTVGGSAGQAATLGNGGEVSFTLPVKLYGDDGTDLSSAKTVNIPIVDGQTVQLPGEYTQGIETISSGDKTYKFSYVADSVNGSKVSTLEAGMFEDTQEKEDGGWPSNDMTKTTTTTYTYAVWYGAKPNSVTANNIIATRSYQKTTIQKYKRDNWFSDWYKVGDPTTTETPLSTQSNKKTIHFMYDKDGTLVPDKELTRDKIVTLNDDGTYDLTLTVSGAAGSITNPQKMDILFIFDRSNSMNNYSRLTYVKTAAKSLVNTLQDNKAIDARYSIVTFSSKNNSFSGNGTADDSWYHLGWTECKQTGDYWNPSNNIADSIDEISPRGGTNYQAGIRKGITQLNSCRPGSQKVVVFLTDGLPTYHIGGGNGSDDSRSYNINAAVEEIKGMNADAFYAIGVGSDFDNQWSTPVQNLNKLCNNVQANQTGLFTVGDNGSSSDLEKVFKDIAGDAVSILCSDVTVTDTLSENVEIVTSGSGTPVPNDFTITVENQNGQQVVTGKGSVQVDGVTITASYNAETRQIVLDFPDDYQLKKGYTYKVTTKIQATEAAYEAYRNNRNSYPDTGDKGTGTHAEHAGLYTNNKATVDYTYNGKDYSAEYPMPVIQLDPGTLTITKQITGDLTEEQIAALENSIKFEVELNGVKTSYPLSNFTSQGDNSYTMSIAGLSPNTQYIVTESGADLPDYILTQTPTGGTQTGTVAKGGTATAAFTNNYKVATRDISVTKVWEGSETNPESVTVWLYADKEKTNKSVTLNAENNWTDSFTGLDIYSTAGEVIDYTVQEETVDGYTGVVTGDMTAGFTITNTRDTGSLTIKKTIEGLDGNDAVLNNLKNQLEFTVTGPDGYSEEIAFNATGWKQDGNTYTYTINNLPTGEYTVEEAGYDLTKYGYNWTGTKSPVKGTVNDDDSVTVPFTNTYTPANINLTITKEIQGDPYGDGRDMFSFRITCIDCADDTNVGKVWYVHINGNDSKTITLPVGKYKVEELSNMHYKFVSVVPEPEEIPIDTRVRGKLEWGYDLTEDETITFTNEPVTSNIPSDGGGVENHFDKYEDGKIVWKPEEYGDDGEIQPKPTPEPSGE